MRPRWSAHPPRAAFGWRRGAAYAVLWSLAVFVLETVWESSVVESRGWLPSAASGYPGWLFIGVVLAAFAALAVPLLPTAGLIGATTALLLLLTLIRAAFPELLVDLKVGSTQSPFAASEDTAIFLGWSHLVYGGLFVGAGAVAHRSEQTRSLLARAEIARSRSQALFSQAQFGGLQGSVDPAFLLRVLEGMQSRYRTDAARAERLLDQLVGFLRLAMPGVRSGQSTLGAELALARSHARLANELEPRNTRWHCDIDASLADLPFPPLLLLPLLEQSSAGASGAAGIALTATRAPTQVVLALQGAVRPGWLAGDLLHRLQVGLRATHGQVVGVVLSPVREPGAPALTMTLPLPEPSPHAAPARPSTPPPQGASTWTTTPLPATT
jgi:hypothetical protein